VFWRGDTQALVVVDNEVEVGVAGVFVGWVPCIAQVGLLDDDQRCS
jgi:hypothetical protein